MFGADKGDVDFRCEMQIGNKLDSSHKAAFETNAGGGAVHVVILVLESVHHAVVKSGSEADAEFLFIVGWAFVGIL